jgi:hypothetical protein
MKTKKQKALPKEILVLWEGEDDESYLSASETNAGIEDGTKVGVYQLVAVKTQKVSEELV